MSSSISEGEQRGTPRRRLVEGVENAQNPIDLLDSDESESDHGLKNNTIDLLDSDESESDSENQYHHPGELEPGNDKFADWDDDCHGNRYSNSIKRDYPDEYVWDCCGARGTSRGCTEGEGEGETIEEKYATSPEPELEECVIHSGELEVNLGSRTWDDYDEVCQGPMDSKTNQCEYPEGFIRNCCDKEGTYASGCEGEEREDEEDDEWTKYMYILRNYIGV
jgi:hypothetical protein